MLDVSIACSPRYPPSLFSHSFLLLLTTRPSLPCPVVFGSQRFTKNNFFLEKNPTIVNFPLNNLEMRACKVLGLCVCVPGLHNVVEGVFFVINPACSEDRVLPMPWGVRTCLPGVVCV